MSVALASRMRGAAPAFLLPHTKALRQPLPPQRQPLAPQPQPQPQPLPLRLPAPAAHR